MSDAHRGRAGRRIESLRATRQPKSIACEADQKTLEALEAIIEVFEYRGVKLSRSDAIRLAIGTYAGQVSKWFAETYYGPNHDA